MIFNRMRKGYYGEWYRFQITGVTTLIVMLSSYILFTITAFLFQPLELFYWIAGGIVFAFLLIAFSKMLLIYKEGFVITTMKKKSAIPQQISFTEMEKVQIHINEFRASNNFTFYYYQDGEVLYVSYRISDDRKPIESLRFLHMKGVPIYVDKEYYAADLFSVSKNKLHSQDIKGTTWYFFSGYTKSSSKVMR